ncbi:diguanylate cyclase [Patulibacter minatonensis]|uniref:diguanylate cyclase n=1 Tax=Patulibacter minatonensis TaxID=298163 RepID=UPI0012F9D8CA|nr:diguanylate cyclase [Patulibacter minatonensis]
MPTIAHPEAAPNVTSNSHLRTVTGSPRTSAAGALADPARLDVLRRLGLMGALPDDAFDRVTRLATKLTGAPISLAVLVDDERQWFAGQTGLAEPWATRRQTPLSHSFCQHVVSDAAPLVVTDARDDDRLRDNRAIPDLGVIAYAGVPLVCGGVAVGSLCLIDGEPHEWSADELDVLRDLAAMTTTELELRLAIVDQEAAGRARVREQEALRAVATLVAGQGPPRAVFAAAAEHVAHVCSAAMSRVVRLEPDGTTRLVGAWAQDAPSAPEVGRAVVLDEGTAIATVVRTRRPAAVSGRGVPADAAELDDPAAAMRAGAAAPIEVDGRFWGAISVGWEDAATVDREEISRVTRFADLVSLAVTGAEARQQLSELAFTDHLTGLHNQRAFSDRLEEEVRRCRRYRRPLSLVVFDLDHFKLINDTHGHESGNRALAEFAERLVAVRRGSDVIARVGGEEFAWMLPETDGRSAMVAAERARAAISDLPFSDVGRITSSVGICSLDDADDAQQLYRHADLALYWAKAAGRNTIVRYTPELISAPPGGAAMHRLESAKTLAAVRALASAVDAKDPSTQRHSERVAELAGELARTLGWDPARVVLLHSAALVHDVGKIGVPDTILLKPAKLTDAEYEQVKTHAALGAEMVADLLSREQVLWIRHHHERHDGHGYPDGVADDQISDGAKIMAVADAWDAMTGARPYGRPRPLAEAIEEMRRGAGSQFDPTAIEALLLLHQRGGLRVASSDPTT